MLENSTQRSVLFSVQKEISESSLKKQVSDLCLKYKDQSVEVFSVRSEFDFMLREVFETQRVRSYRFWDLVQLIEKSAASFQIENLYQSFGLDRFLNLLGLKELLGRLEKALVIDLGTCTTVTGLSLNHQKSSREKDVYRLSENLIFPGIKKQILALENIASLEKVLKTEEINSDLKKSLQTQSEKEYSTYSSILRAQSQIVIALSQFYQEKNYKVILTGGFSSVFQNLTKNNLNLQICQELFLFGYSALKKSILEKSKISL